MCCNALSLFPPDAFRISHRFLPASICCICFVPARSFLRRVPDDNAELSLPLFLHIRSNKVFLVQLFPYSKCTSRTFSASHDVLCNNCLLTPLFTAFKFAAFPVPAFIIDTVNCISYAFLRFYFSDTSQTQNRKHDVFGVDFSVKAIITTLFSFHLFSLPSAPKYSRDNKVRPIADQ